jgi:hypothetical protein
MKMGLLGQIKEVPPMFLAAKTTEAASAFQNFDIFMVIFTILIAAGLVRLMLQRPRKNVFAIGFGTVALLVFLIADVKMVSGW